MRGAASIRMVDAPDDHDQSHPAIVVFGNLTVDDVVFPDGRTQMGTLGGNAIHCAAAASVWGVSVGVVARAGEDFPRQALIRLREARVDTTGVRSVTGPTVRNWVIYEEDGRRSWVYRTPLQRSLEVAPRFSDVPTRWLGGEAPPVVHIAGMPLTSAREIAEGVRSRRADAVILLDTHEDWSSDGTGLLETARLVDFFVPSREELALMVGYDRPREAARRLVEDGVRQVVVKLGAGGALYDSREGASGLVASPLVDVVDTTGAGDAFCGGLAAAVSLGEELAVGVRRAIITAAAAIGGQGSLRMLDGRADLAHAMLRAGDNGVVTVPEADRHDVGVMRQEIQTIPEVLAEILKSNSEVAGDCADWLHARGVENLFVGGCGDSAFIGEAAELLFARRSRVGLSAVHALQFARYRVRHLPSKSALIAVSYSGKVGRTIEAAVQARRFGHPVIALTGDPGSRLAEVADRVLPVTVPTLGFAPGTSTYVAMLTRLMGLALCLPEVDDEVRHELGVEMEALPGLASETLKLCAAPVQEAARRLLDARCVAFLGAGPNEATAKFGAAKLFEGAQQLAFATNVEEWAHEQYFITRTGDPVVLIGPTGATDDRIREIFSELRWLRTRTVFVGVDEIGDGVVHLPLAPGISEDLSPVIACLPVSQLGFELAQLAGKHSYNFPSREAEEEHYETIHRATVGEPV